LKKPPDEEKEGHIVTWFIDKILHRIPIPKNKAVTIFTKEEVVSTTIIIPVNMTIQEAINKAIRISGKKNELVSFVFQGVTVYVRADSDPELILNDCLLVVNGHIITNRVGPYPDRIKAIQSSTIQSASGSSLQAIRAQ
jgi:hypothetical protein